MMNFLKCSSVCPRVFPADPEANAAEIIRLLIELDQSGVQAAVFPELALTGASLGDLFFQDRLWTKVQNQLEEIRLASKGSDLLFVVGSPIRSGPRLFNAAVVFQNGRILGIVPKVNLSDKAPLNESRWFTSPSGAEEMSLLTLNGQEIPFGELLFQGEGVTLAVELAEDLSAPHSPSTEASLSGADVILCPAAAYEVAGGAKLRRNQILAQSARCHLGYVYASSGVDESTTDFLYSGHLLITEDDQLLNENLRFQRESEFITAWLDLDLLRQQKLKSPLFKQRPFFHFHDIPISTAPPSLESFDRWVDPNPFIPQDQTERQEHCRDILSIQSHALARRMRAIGAKKCVLGISGGLDSTLALLVAIKAQQINGGENSDLITVTMPGFGTMDRTYQNAVTLCRELGSDLREINIIKACLQHFKDIGHDPEVHDSTYENTQARERTQILMDIANKEHSFVIGTGDLSELALGWATYNGDHMSMYGVNASVPKTLVRELVSHIADHEAPREVAKVLKDILTTPVSPELLPKSGSDDFVQKTEDLIGPYELHDFFLWHLLKNGHDPDTILFLARHAFQGTFSEEEIRSWLKVFIRRFFTNQFKRSALPDGPTVGSISLSPRGGLTMPSDVTWRSWTID